VQHSSTSLLKVRSVVRLDVKLCQLLRGILKYC
jgi:hypothetical protein